MSELYKARTHSVFALQWNNNLKQFKRFCPTATRLEIKGVTIDIVLPTGRRIILLPTNWLVYRAIDQYDTWAVMGDSSFQANYEEDNANKT